MRDFRYTLQKEFAQRVQKNSRYSVRAYARALGIAPSALSAILRNKRPLTNKMILRLASPLGLPANDTAKFLKKRKSANEETSYSQLVEDEFDLQSNGIYNALLEMLNIEGENLEVAALAKRLDSTPTEIQLCLEKLVRLKLIEKTANGYRDLTGGFTSRLKENSTNSARKNMQISLRQRSIEAIKRYPVSARNDTSMMFAISLEDLPEAYEKIKKFRREMDKFFSHAKTKQEVYTLAISLFPFTKLEKIQELK